MLTGVRIYSSDAIWRQILRELNAVVLDAPEQHNVNLDNISIHGPISALELKSLVIKATDGGDILQKIFGRDVCLSQIKSKILILLYKTGGMTGGELKQSLGYAPETSTHAVDTAIYQLRRTYGRGFIINTNGVYRIGKL